MQKIKCHTCGRDAIFVNDGMECNIDRHYKDFQCGKGHITRLYMDEMNNGSLYSVRTEEWIKNI